MSHLLRSYLYTMPKISPNVLDYMRYGGNNKMTLKRNIVSLQIKQKPLSGSCHWKGVCGCSAQNRIRSYRRGLKATNLLRGVFKS